MNTDNKFENDDMKITGEEENKREYRDIAEEIEEAVSFIHEKDTDDENDSCIDNDEDNSRESDNDEGRGDKKASDLGSFGFGPFGFGPGIGDVYGKNGYGDGRKRYDDGHGDGRSYDGYGDRYSNYDRDMRRDNHSGNGNGGNNGNRNGDNGNNGNGSKGNGKKGGSRLSLLIFAAIITILMVYFMGTMYENATSEEISYNKFLTMLENGEVESVEITSEGKIIITPIEGSGLDNSMVEKTYWTTAISVDNLHEELKEAAKNHNVDFKADVSDSKSTIVDILLAYVLPFILIYFLMGLLFKKMGRGGAMGVGKSKAKMYMEKETGVTFADVAGQDEAKESLKEIVDFLHNPEKYAKVGAKLPKGALLVGPPGTGKTLLAKAVAGEGHVPFFSLSGSDFVELYVGVGASRVRDLFKTAQQNAPCIIFIDEIDAIGRSRDSKYGGGNDEREQTLNQLLAEMDGFDSSKGIFMLGATNRPDVLDKALLRPGRFDRRVIVDKPDLKGRVDILKVHAKNVRMDETVDLDAMGLATSGAVGADLANMINEAAINAVKQGRKAISQADLLEAVEVVIAGKEKKDRILSAVEKKTVAYHEVGHALITALEKNAEPVQKITIVPRTMGSLGYVMQVPEEEKYLMTKDELITRITTLLGGRAAEAICFDTVTTGAANDMEKATALARAMVTQYGMCESFGLMSLEKNEDTYLTGRTSLNCSDQTATKIDNEVNALLKACYERAIKLLTENKDVLAKIADYLYEKETITGAQFMEIYNEVKEQECSISEKN